MAAPRNRVSSPQQIALSHSSTEKWFKIARDENGNLAYKAGTAPFTSSQIYSGRFSLESVNANIDVPMAFQNWRFGSGFVETDLTKGGGDETYHYSRGVDASWPSRLYISPQLQTGGAVTTTNPNGFLLSSLGLFAWNDRYLYEWTGSAWTERKDVGVTDTINHVVEYRNSTATYIMIAVTNSGYYYSTNGTSFTQVGTTQVAPSYVANNVYTAAPGTELTFLPPSGTADGDYMIIAISKDIDEEITAPSGWAEVYVNGNGALSVHHYAKTFTDDDGTSSYKFTWTTSSNALGIITTYTNVDPLIQFDTIQGGTLSASNSPVSGAGVSYGSLRTAVVTYAGVYEGAAGSTTGVASSGFTERVDSYNGFSSKTFWAYVQDDTTITEGAVSAATLAISSAGTLSGAALMYILRPEPVGPTGIVRFAVRGSSTGEPTLWALDANGDFRQTDDPTDEKAWSYPDNLTLGEANLQIAGLEVMNNVFYLFHEKGITSYDGLEIKTVWDNGTLALESNAANTYVWVDRRAYFTYGGALLQYENESNSITRIWPRGGQVGNPELSGTITAIGGDSRNLYFALKNNSGNYYVMKGDPQQPLSSDSEVIYPFHSWAYLSTNVCEAIAVVPASSDTLSSTNPQLLIGEDASADYYILPKPGMRPEDDSAYRFDTAEGTLTGSWVDSGARTYKKWLNRGRIIGENLAATRYIALNYEIDASGTPVEIASYTSSGVQETSLTSSEVLFGRVRYSVDMDTSVNTSAPRLIGAVLNTTLNPPRKRQWTLVIEIEDDQSNSRGSKARDRDVNSLRSHLFTALNNRVTFTDRDGQTYYVHCPEIQGIDASINLGGKEHYAVTLVEI